MNLAKKARYFGHLFGQDIKYNGEPAQITGVQIDESELWLSIELADRDELIIYPKDQKKFDKIEIPMKGMFECIN